MGELQARIGALAQATGIPSKSIILWPLPFDKDVYPQLNEYILCDGANGTPDMRDYFVRGAPAACTDVIIPCWGTAECASAIGDDCHCHGIAGSSHSHPLGACASLSIECHCHKVCIPGVTTTVIDYCNGPQSKTVVTAIDTMFCTCACCLDVAGRTEDYAAGASNTELAMGLPPYKNFNYIMKL